MKKFIGEMTYEEFKDALKIIISDEGENKEKLTVLQWIKKYFAELKEETINDCKEIKNFFKNLITLKFLFSDKQEQQETKSEETLSQWLEKPLTKELFIERGKKFKAFVYDVVNTLVFVIVMVIIIRFFFGEIRWIPSGSMHPTLLEKDRIIVERYSRFFSEPQRGDIMVFYPPSTRLTKKPLDVLARLTGIFCKDVAYIKRVVGIPGDKIEIKHEKDGSAYVYINDKKYNEPYILSVYDYPPCPDADMDSFLMFSNQIMKCGPFYLDEDSYFMMGDNRGNSQDSRYWGVLKKDRFIGRAVFVFWPLNRIKTLPKIKN